MDGPGHKGLQYWCKDVYRLCRTMPSLRELDCQQEGFGWVDHHDADRSVISYLRWDKPRHQPTLVVCNFTPVPWSNYRLGVPAGGHWLELPNSDGRYYGGSRYGNASKAEASPASFYGRFDHCPSLTLPPLAILILGKDQPAGQ